ncbi:MAG: PKD domain-containing protein [Bacteroidota bacterium]
MIFRIKLTFCVLCLTVSLWAQQEGVFRGVKLNYPTHSELERQFTDYQVYRINADALNNYVKDDRERADKVLSMQLGEEYEWNIYLSPYDMRAADFRITEMTEQGPRTYTQTENKTFRGYLLSDAESKVTLTLDKDFIYGMVKKGNELFFIEPLSGIIGSGGDPSLFIVYNAKDVIPDKNAKCGYTDMLKYKGQMDHGASDEQGDEGELQVGSRMGCREVEMAVAADFSMFTKYGSTTATQNHIFGVMSNVQLNYDNEFNDQIVFLIVEVFVSSCITCDPWTTSNGAGTVLNSFTNWGESGGFSTTYDIAQFWTNRNFSGSTIGIAWLSAVCTSNRYHAIQDFSTNANLMRVLVAHEIGHNFAARHDASGAPFIMAPSVNTSNSWSTASQNSINNHVASRSCLSSCNIIQPPVADFISDATSGCAPLIVSFFDQSTNNPDSWQWTFPGGIPAVSTSQNPNVTYTTPGIYDVTLTASNSAGGNTITRTGYIFVDGPPFAAFTTSILLNNVVFTNLSTNADSYLWDFGDGNFSTEISPEYNYAQDGFYNITLTAFNDCGSTTTTTVIQIVTEPFASFRADITEGCDSLTVQFIDQSTLNVTDWQWTFPGGTPDTSIMQNPTVTYTTPGTYSVTLVVSNLAGSNAVTRTDYITIGGSPTAGFDFTINGTMVDFIDQSIAANSLLWDFGDGNTSTETNPTHIYASGGTYTVAQIAFGDSLCPPDTLLQTIDLNVMPTAAFSADTTEGCATHTVNFVDESTGGVTSWEWRFPGGTPAGSNEQFPIVEYRNPGQFDVTLIVGNALGTDTLLIEKYITVDTVPNANFDFEIGSDLVTVQFSDSSSFADSLFWDFGDGAMSRDTNPEHTYANDGVYTVQLIVKNECGADTSEQDVTIVTLPDAGFTFSADGDCAPVTVTFTDGSSANTTGWQWSFPGGTPASSTDQNPTVVYNSAGSFDVTLIVSNAAGNDTMEVVGGIAVATTPTASFTSSANGRTVDFTNTSSNAVGFLWDFGDGNGSADTNPTHTYAADGSYTVTLTATNACGSVTATATITVSTMPMAGFSANVQSGCAPLTVQFTDQSSANTTGWQWSFPGGTPSSSTDQNPVVIYNNAGNYDVTLVVSNASGSDQVSETNYINVETTPTASFTSSANGRTVDFTNTSSNADSYSWDFGDGNSSTDTNPTHTYATDGSYTVTLTATNACGSVSVSETLTVITPPTGAFSANVQSGCAPLTVQFTDQSSANTTGWQWSFPGGTPSSSTDQNPVVVYNNAGDFDVTLVVSNAAGSDQVVQSNYINVETTPNASFIAQPNIRDVSFTNTSTNADSYSWDFGDGNGSTDVNPNHTYAADGTYTVTLSATNGCGTVMVSQSVVISTAPNANFSSNVQTGCAPLTVQFNDLSSPNTTGWQWSFPGGTPATSTAQNPTVTYNSPGSYDVILEVSNASGTDRLERQTYIVVNTVPIAGFSSTVNGVDANFTNTSTNATSFSWDFGDGNSSLETNPSHTYAGDGTYTVTLTATNECGSVQTSQSVVVVTPPTSNFIATTRFGCAPFTTQFNSTASANTTSWNWSFPGGTPSTSTDENPVVTYANPGTYTVSLQVSNAAGSDLEEKIDYITVITNPVAGFDFNVNGVNVDFTNTSTNATSFSWDFGDGNSSLETNPSHTYAGDGTYTVTLTALNECGSTEISQTVVIVTPPDAGFTVSGNEGCAPLTVQFTDQSSANTTGWQWSFPGGTPSTSTDQNPTVVYSTPGTYSVTLEVSNAAGTDVVTQTDIIVVGDGPTASFTTQLSGANADFTNTSTNATSFSWDFGDGNGSTDVNPSHTYAGDGTYTVVLTATNECGSMMSTQMITIITPPTGGFSANVQSGCAPLTVQFSDQSSANTTAWSWSFPGGSPATSTDQNPLVIYDTPGTYNVTLTVSNAAGTDEVVQNGFIVVESVPTADFSSMNFGSTVNFTNTSTNADSYVWDFGDGNTSTDVNPSHTYASDGTYTVTLTATNECGDATAEQTVTIVTPPDAGFSADVQSGCAPLTVQFTDQSSANTTAWNWSFPGGTPSSSTDQNPVVTYNTPGTYDVTLVASTGAGNSTFSQTAYINVEGAPTAGFSTSAVGSTVNFTNTSTGANSYTWDFGDGSSSTSVNPEHTYPGDGSYTVVMTAINDCGSTTSTQVVTIITPPTAGFSSDIQSGCAPMTVQFSDESSDNVVDYSWTFTGGTPATSTDANPVVVYNTPGVYAVSLTVSNGAGSSTAEQLAYIEVDQGPTAAFTASVMDNQLSTTNNSLNGDTYLWDFGDGNTSTELEPEHIYAASGQYNVVLVVTNACGSDTTQQTVTVTVVTIPVAQFSASETEGCAPLTVNFTDESSANTTNWEWSFPGGTPATSTEQNPTVTYSTPGVYEVSLIASNAAGSNTNQKIDYITVAGGPEAGFTSNTTVTVVDFTNTSIDGDTYRWDFGDGTTSTDENPTHDFGINGTYTVQLIAMNACGSDTVEQEIVISMGVGPLAGLSSSVDAGCIPLEVNFTDQSQGDPDTWAWEFEGGTPATSGDQNPTVTYDTPGTYDVELIVTNGNGRDTITFVDYITVEPAPTAEFSFTSTDGEVTFDNSSANGETYEWDFGDGNSSTEENPVHTYATSGNFEVTLIVTNDCGSDTTTMMVSIELTSVEDPDFVQEFLLYPNPNSGAFTLILRGEARDWLEVSFFDVLGRRVYSEDLDFRLGNLNKQFNFDQVASGTYMMQIRSEREVAYRKVVINK